MVFKTFSAFVTVAIMAFALGDNSTVPEPVEHETTTLLPVSGAEPIGPPRNPETQVSDESDVDEVGLGPAASRDEKLTNREPKPEPRQGSNVEPPLRAEDVWAELRKAENGDRLHHSDACDPLRADRLFKKLINLPLNSLTASGLAVLKLDIENTCDWRRYMTCEPTRHRCVCAVDAVWAKRDDSDSLAVRYMGTCVLRANSVCYESVEAHRKDTANPLGINPPFAPCLLGTSCQNGRCKCVSPGTQECEDAENVFQASVTKLKEMLNKLKWAGHGDPCDYRSRHRIDLRVHTLRSLTLAAERWVEKHDSLQHECDFHEGLECYPEDGDRLGSKGTCACKKGSTWYQGTCRGEHGSLCEIRMWAEADAVPYQRDGPCMPELTCTEVKYWGTESKVKACCYTGIYQYRTHEVSRDKMYLCSTGFKHGVSFLAVNLMLLLFSVFQE